MNKSLLDFSLRRDLSLHAAVVAAVEDAASALGVHTMITGAFARDLHVTYRHGIATQRQTEDVDFAIAVSNWQVFSNLTARLLDGGSFRAVDGRTYRFRHVDSALPVDLVPFTGIETPDRRIAWPPDGAIVMDVFGFREAHANAVRVRLPHGVEAKVVSVPGLALLKIVAWNDRHVRAPFKDAPDLMLIASSYLQLGNEPRLWKQFAAWTEEGDFDYEVSGARMLGLDVKALLDARDVGRIVAILEQQISTGTRFGELVMEMNRFDPDRARRIIAGIVRGLSES